MWNSSSISVFFYYGNNHIYIPKFNFRRGKMLNQRSVLKKVSGLLSLLFVFVLLTGCGGGGTSAVVNEQVPLSGSNTVIPESVKVEMTIGSKIALVNGKSVSMDVPPQIVNGVTMVPLRFIADHLGSVSQWEADTQTITLQYLPLSPNS